MASEFSFSNQVLTEVAKWAVPLVGGLLAVFFTPLVEQLKLRVSRAELRIKQYEEFAKDLSTFLFQAELQHEFLSADWATPKDHEEITKEYNAAITTLRAKELVYLAWAERYWRASERSSFEEVLKLVRQVDAAVHAFNDGEVTSERLRILFAKNAELKTATMKLLAPRALAIHALTSSPDISPDRP